MLTCHEPCVAQGRHRFSLPLSTLARRHARFVSLTICQGNYFQEITVGCCWRSAPAANLHWSTFFPGCKHVAKVTSLTVHLFPSGTWVENASQKRCQTISTFLLVLVLEHSPGFESMTSRNQGNQRKSFTFTLGDTQGVNCSTHKQILSCSPTNCWHLGLRA